MAVLVTLDALVAERYTFCNALNVDLPDSLRSLLSGGEKEAILSGNPTQKSGSSLGRRRVDMEQVSEIDALKVIDETLSGLDNQDARNRVLAWAWDKFSSKPGPAADEDQEPTEAATRTKRPKKKTHGASAKGKRKAKRSLTMVKDLNLKPESTESLDEFVEIKKPSSYYEKCTVSAYYLKHELSVARITEDHVYTCFKHMNWRIPADLSNTLAFTASRYGWLDTSNLQDIRVTTKGENLVEHDLPKGKGSKKP